MKLKKILVPALSVLILFPNSSVFAESIEPSNDINIEGREVLINAGWTNEEIDDLLTDSEIADYNGTEVANTATHYVKQTVQTKVEGNSNLRSSSPSDLTLTPIEGTEKMVSLSEAEFYKELEEAKEAEGNTQKIIENSEPIIDVSNSQNQSALTTVSPTEVNYVTDDGFMKYTMQAFKEGTGKYKLNLRFEWLKQPKNRGIDILALGHGTGLVQIGTQNDIVFNAKYDATIMLGGTVNTNVQPLSYKSRKTDSGGSMVSFKLPESSLNFLAQNARGYMSYHAKVSNSTEIVASVSGYYKHKVQSLNVTPTLNWPLGGGLTISSSSTYVDETPPPYFSVNLK